MYPTKYAKFGDRPFASLDEILFEDGMKTRGDTISCGLWTRARYGAISTDGLF
jgi:hypothetical protein